MYTVEVLSLKCLEDLTWAQTHRVEDGVSGLDPVLVGQDR
jgi:hypothetical protein